MLQTGQSDGSHTSAMLAKHALGVLDYFRILNHTVISVVRDEPAIMVAAGRRMGEGIGFKSNVCATHRLQTISRLAVDETKGVGRLLSNCRRQVKFFKHSAVASWLLAENQLIVDLRRG